MYACVNLEISLVNYVCVVINVFCVLEFCVYSSLDVEIPIYRGGHINLFSSLREQRESIWARTEANWGQTS
eukprot:COSAG02_NODE_998_length_15331_cov_38.406119_8_plen_71_part_00